MNSYTVDSRLGAVRGGQRPEPPSAQSFIVVLCAVLCSPGVGTGAQPHCEISLHASQGLAHRKAPQLSQPPSRRAACTAQLVALGAGRGAGCAPKNPKPVHLAAKPAACGCQGWFCGQSKVWNGFSVPFYTKGTNHCVHPLYQCRFCIRHTCL